MSRKRGHKESQTSGPPIEEGRHSIYSLFLIFEIQVVPRQQYAVKIKACVGEKSTKAICQVEIFPLSKDVSQSNKSKNLIMNL